MHLPGSEVTSMVVEHVAFCDESFATHRAGEGHPLVNFHVVAKAVGRAEALSSALGHLASERLGAVVDMHVCL